MVLVSQVVEEGYMSVNSLRMGLGFGSLLYVPLSYFSSHPLLLFHWPLDFHIPRLMANGQRSDVPSSVTRDATSIDTTALGTPDAEYLSSGCDIETSFTGPSILLPSPHHTPPLTLLPLLSCHHGRGLRAD